MGYNEPIGGYLEIDKLTGVLLSLIPYNFDMKTKEEWLRLNTFQFPDGKWHLHSRYLKGDMVWVLSGRRSKLCKLEGRCRIVEIKTL